MEINTNNRCFFNVMILFSLLFVAHAGDEFSCVYTFYFRTGSIIKAGTDSKIDVEVWNKYGDGSKITNIESWGGLMGEGYDYFERGNLDVFSGRGPCLSSPVCAVKIISDGTGRGHGWYLNYVEITTTGPHKGCAQQEFTVERWLATDTSPYELTAEVDYCAYDDLTKDRPVNLRDVSSS